MNTAIEIAKILLKIKAITLNTKQPYRYASGILSPIYCDNRLLISYPDERQKIIDAFLQCINENQLEADVIAGTATAGIPHAAWLADRSKKPMIYIRNQSKSHGKQNQIEGKINPGQTVLLIEDLISTGQSALTCAATLKEANIKVIACLGIFNYEMNSAKNAFTQANIPLYTLSNFSALLKTAIENGYLTADEEDNVKRWQLDPTHWVHHIL